MSEFPRSGNAVTAAWLAAALRPRFGETVIETLAAAPLEDSPSYNGTFSLAAIVAPNGSSDYPVSVVIKMVPSNPGILALGRQLGIYRREACFYRDIGSSAGIRVPDCYGAVIDEETGDSAIVLEDLTHLRTGNQSGGFVLPDARLALTQYARLHAQWWQSERLASFEWLPVWNDPAMIEFVTQSYAQVWPNCMALFEAHLDEDAQALGTRLAEALPSLMEHAGMRPVTLVHGDARHDNLMFADNGTPPHVVDWQFTAVGRAMVDVAYYLCQGGDAAVVGPVEIDLVREYHAALVSFGVTGYDFEECWEDYRRFAFYTLVYPVFAAGLIDPASTLQREAVAIILNRAFAAARRLGADEF